MVTCFCPSVYLLLSAAQFPNTIQGQLMCACTFQSGGGDAVEVPQDPSKRGATIASKAGTLTIIFARNQLDLFKGRFWYPGHTLWSKGNSGKLTFYSLEEHGLYRSCPNTHFRPSAEVFPLPHSSLIHPYDLLFSFMLLAMCIASDYISVPNYYWQTWLFLGTSVYYILHSGHGNSFSLIKSLCQSCRFHDLLQHLPTFCLECPTVPQMLLYFGFFFLTTS